MGVLAWSMVDIWDFQANVKGVCPDAPEVLLGRV